MDQVAIQDRVIEVLLVERTRALWQEYPDFTPLLEPLHNIINAPDTPHPPTLPHLVKLMQLACESDQAQATKVFTLLESYCAIVEPTVLTQLLARFILDAGEIYPPLMQDRGASAWLEWALDYRQDLEKKGRMAQRLWRLAATRGKDTERYAPHHIALLGMFKNCFVNLANFTNHDAHLLSRLAIQSIVSRFAQRQEYFKDPSSSSSSSSSSRSDASESENLDAQKRRHHDILYMLHCGPLADQDLEWLEAESLLNVLARMADGLDCRSFENQLLILVNLLDRTFHWLDSIDSSDSIEQLKSRIVTCARQPELLAFTMDAVFKYLDGRWNTVQAREEIIRPKAPSVALIDINREREPIHYLSTDGSGSFSYANSKHAIRGKPLKERELPRRPDRSPSTREFELSDLTARCLRGHDAIMLEQVIRRFILHLGMRVDTAMVSATAAIIKHAAQQRDKILLRLVAENPVYQRIMMSALEIDTRSASLCLPVIQGMLRCSIGHWTSCKNSLPKAYPKELEEATWLARLAYQTGLVPDPIGQASALFPLVDSKDLGLLLEQCFYILLIRNADRLQRTEKVGPRLEVDRQGQELLLIRRLIFKHATRAFHLMPLFSGPLSLSNTTEHPENAKE